MKKKTGFTLIELIVTIALLAIIGTIIAVNMVGLNQKQTVKETNRIESTIKAAAEAYAEVQDDNGQTVENCVSVRELINKGYLKESDVKNYQDKDVIFNQESGKYTGEYKIGDGSECGLKNKEYTVSFNANGGVLQGDASKTVTYDKTYGDLPSASRKDYDFLGWYTKKTGGEQIKKSSTVKITNDTTFYAHWKSVAKTEYTLTLKKGKQIDAVYINDVTSDTKDDGSVSATILVGTKVSISVDVYEPDGYSNSFYKWESNDTELLKTADFTRYDVEFTMPNRDVELTAQSNGISAISYNVTLDPNGGTVNNSIINVKYNETYGSLPNPTRNGYQFSGWYTSLNGGTKITSSSKVTTAYDHTLYAHWEKNSVKVKFIASEDAALYTVERPSYPLKEYEKEYIVGEKYSDLPTARKNYSNFLGWYTEKEGGEKITEDTLVTLTEDHTLYMHWKDMTFEVKFVIDNEVIATQQYKLHEKYKNIPKEKTKEGYTFEGWYRRVGYDYEEMKETHEFTFSTTTYYGLYKDDIPPTCGEIKRYSKRTSNSTWGNPLSLLTGNDEWSSNPQKFIIGCKDSGSGCKADEYTYYTHENNTPKADTIEFQSVDIYDNANNKTQCTFRVNGQYRGSYTPTLIDVNYSRLGWDDVPDCNPPADEMTIEPRICNIYPTVKAENALLKASEIDLTVGIDSDYNFDYQVASYRDTGNSNPSFSGTWYNGYIDYGYKILPRSTAFCGVTEYIFVTKDIPGNKSNKLTVRVHLTC